MQLQTLKGFRDFLPHEAIKRDWLKSKIIDVFKLWGYDPLETPTLEPLELFKGQIGEDEKLFYHFKDSGNREVALRYDQSVPASRVVGQYAQTLPIPFRRYQIQPAFRAENPQKGRYREFLQCDADIFGISSPLADAEVIALSLDIYRKIGAHSARVLINDRVLLKDIPYPAITAIDKLAKIGEDGVIADMVKKGITKEKSYEYLSFVKNMQPNETISFIMDYLSKLGFKKESYLFDPTIARSFSYSTGPIWEVQIPEFSGGSVLGGERFDKLVYNLSGRDIPATGFAVGFDRTLEAAEELGLIPNVTTGTQVLVSIFSSELTDYSLSITKLLRDAGINTEIYPDNETKLDRQLKYADKKGIPYVVIAGPDEKKENRITVKDLVKRSQSKTTPEELINSLNIEN